MNQDLGQLSRLKSDTQAVKVVRVNSDGSITKGMWRYEMSPTEGWVWIEWTEPPVSNDKRARYTRWRMRQKAWANRATNIRESYNVG